MSLIAQVKSEQNKRLNIAEKAGTVDERPMIVQSSQLVSILRSIVDENIVDKKDKKAFKDFRTRLKDARWRLAGVLSHVHSDLWKEQIQITLDSMRRHINNTQPNGEWKLFDYEVDIQPGLRGDDYIVLAALWVDSLNEKDLRYANGMPVTDVNVDISHSNKELIEALTSKQDSSNDDELKQLMKQFIAAVASREIGESAPKEEVVIEAETPEEPAEDASDFDDGFED